MPNNVKITTFPNPLDLIAPHSCRGCGRIGAPLCDCCKNHIIKSHQNILPNIYAVGHRSELLNQLIHELKYSSIRALATPLADVLNQILPNFKTKTIIVPLPTISKHIRERGLDHTHLIAKKLTKLRHNFTYQPILSRANSTVQVGSNRKTRLTQAKSAYEINPKTKINPNATYLLLDDVWTTGASMQAAYKKLQQAGAKKIKIAVLAISQI